MKWYKCPGDVIDFISFVVAYAPDQFRYEDYRAPDDQMTLDRAFAELRDGLARAANEVGDSFRLDRFLEMLEESHKHYREGKTKEAAWKLQDLQDELKDI